MNKGTVIACKEQDSRFGGQEKICDVEVEFNPGQPETVRVYAKSHSKAGKQIFSYPKIREGVVVELTPKNNGTGYFIQSVIGEAPAAPPPRNEQAPARREPDKKAQAEYIETKAGQLFYAYTCLQEKFGNVLVTEETLRAFASTILISLDRHGPQ